MEQESKTEPQITESNIEVSSMVKSIMEVLDGHMLRDSWTGLFSSNEQRLRSYDDCQWPRDAKPTPDALSEAGFYATGK